MSNKRWLKEESVHMQDWPEYDDKLVVDEIVTIPVQVDGKLRGQVVVEVGSSKDLVKEKAMESDDVKKYLGDGVKDIVYVQDRIFNIVTK